MKTNNKDRGHFAQTPLQLLKDKREGITSYTLAVYAAIQSYADFGKTTGAHPTTAQLAERAHCSGAKVERERKRLRELGYLTWVSGNFKRHQGNAYTLFPSNRGSIDHPIDGNTDHPIEATQRASSNQEPLPRVIGVKSAHGGRHIDKLEPAHEGDF